MKQGANPFTVLFEKNIYRSAADPSNSTLTGNIRNADPAFDSINVTRNSINQELNKITQARQLVITTNSQLNASNSSSEIHKPL